MESLSNSILALDGLGKKTWQLHGAVPLNSRHCACLFVTPPYQQQMHLKMMPGELNLTNPDHQLTGTNAKPSICQYSGLESKNVLRSSFQLTHALTDACSSQSRHKLSLLLSHELSARENDH